MRTTIRRVVFALLASVAPLVPDSACLNGLRAASIWQQFAVNNLSTRLDVSAGYNGVGSVPLDFDTDTKSGVASPSPLFVLPASALKLPISSDPKDKAEILAELMVEYGAPVPGALHANDSLLFSARGTVSSRDGHNLAGNPAEAKATAQGSVNFFLDADFGGAVRGSLVGNLLLPPLRPLADHEGTLKISILENRFPAFPGYALVATQVAGDPARAIPLIGHSGYRILFDYEARVPFGVDPPFAVELPLLISEPCDLNGDGAVDAGDAGLLFAAWGSSRRPTADKNQDGFVDAADAQAMFAAWTGDPGPLAVPEPSSLASLGAMVALFAARHAQRVAASATSGSVGRSA